VTHEAKAVPPQREAPGTPHLLEDKLRAQAVSLNPELTLTRWDPELLHLSSGDPDSPCVVKLL
jgi:hypothetical protein